jgi:hypothetical protein
VGDIVGGIFGSGSRTSQDVKLDPTTQALNRMRLDQARNLYSQGSLGSYAQPGGSAYTADPRVSSLYDQAMGTASTPFDLAGYEQRGLDRGLFNEGLDVSRGNINQGLGNVAANYADASGNTLASYNNALAGSDYAYNRGMANNDFYTNRALQYGTDAASNYINQIATPQLMQQATLQGLEGGGAVPASIAKATADVGLQYLSPIVQQSLGNQAALNQANMGNVAQLSGANAAAQAQLAGQNTALQSGLYGDYSNAVNAAYGNRQGLESQFMSTLPSAYGTSITAPAQARSLAAQGAATLFPLADYGRGLQEQDLLRRQGLATTAYTGLPYTPATSTAQRQSTQPLWNFFGQG